MNWSVTSFSLQQGHVLLTLSVSRSRGKHLFYPTWSINKYDMELVNGECTSTSPAKHSLRVDEVQNWKRMSSFGSAFSSDVIRDSA